MFRLVGIWMLPEEMEPKQAFNQSSAISSILMSDFKSILTKDEDAAMPATTSRELL